jgi:ATP-dependent exoDNAse (exonuclease V) beta subunit
LNFIIYKSSAGSGKTFTLSNEYLKLALSSDSPSRYKNILAITFTNKAAQEMKSRVVNYLSLLSNPDSTQKGSDLIKNTLLAYLEISPETLKERANIL